jgi:L-threonylcarbamoyladenylate synthase
MIASQYADTLLNDASAMDAVIRLIEDGGVMGYPTETVYGLGGDPFDRSVVTRIQQLKGRGEGKPFLLLIPSRSDLASLVRPPSDAAYRLMETFWPGPLTLVFEALPDLPSSLSGSDGRIGLRISPDPFCRRFMEDFGGPLISTSANPSDRPPARSPGEVAAYFGESLDLIVDGGRRDSGIVSTVVDVSGSSLRLLREGALSKSAMENVTGEIDES